MTLVTTWRPTTPYPYPGRRPLQTAVLWLAVLAAWLGLAAPDGSATVLLFRPATGSFDNYAPLPRGYGNRVESEVQDGFLYGLDGGPTPNVVVVSETYFLPTLHTWDNDYGDLHNVVACEDVFALVLVADPGFLVTLNSFDMASWPHIDYTINYVVVLDQDFNELYRADQPVIYGAPDGPQHTTFDFTDLGITGRALYIVFDSQNVDPDDVGITNINFSQSGE